MIAIPIILIIISIVVTLVNLRIRHEAASERKKESERQRKFIASLVETERHHETNERERDEIAVSRLACGARTLRLDSIQAKLLLNLVEEGKRHLLRKGDFVVLCSKDCNLCHGCPLVKDYVKIQDVAAIKDFCKRIVGDSYLADMERNLADIGDGDVKDKALLSVAERFKGFLFETKGRNGLVVAPMLLEMNDGNDSGNGRGDSRRGQNNIADV